MRNIDTVVRLENVAEWNDRAAYNIACKLDAIGRNHRLNAEVRERVTAELTKTMKRLQGQAFRLWVQAFEVRYAA